MRVQTCVKTVLGRIMMKAASFGRIGKKDEKRSIDLFQIGH